MSLMAIEDLNRWLDEQIERERRKLDDADDPADAAFIDGLVDGFKLVKRRLDEERANQRAVLGRHRDSLARCMPEGRR